MSSVSVQPELQTKRLWFDSQTGLPETSELQPEQITAVRKEYLRRRPGTRAQLESTIRSIAKNVVFSLGVQPKDIRQPKLTTAAYSLA